MTRLKTVPDAPITSAETTATTPAPEAAGGAEIEKGMKEMIGVLELNLFRALDMLKERGVDIDRVFPGGQEVVQRARKLIADLKTKDPEVIRLEGLKEITELAVQKGMTPHFKKFNDKYTPERLQKLVADTLQISLMLAIHIYKTCLTHDPLDYQAKQSLEALNSLWDQLEPWFNPDTEGRLGDLDKARAAIKDFSIEGLKPLTFGFKNWFDAVAKIKLLDGNEEDAKPTGLTLRNAFYTTLREHGPKGSISNPQDLYVIYQPLTQEVMVSLLSQNASYLAARFSRDPYSGWKFAAGKNSLCLITLASSNAISQLSALASKIYSPKELVALLQIHFEKETLDHFIEKSEHQVRDALDTKRLDNGTDDQVSRYQYRLNWIPQKEQLDIICTEPSYVLSGTAPQIVPERQYTLLSLRVVGQELVLAPADWDE